MKNKKYLIIIIGVIIYVFIAVGQERVAIEELETINGVGYHIKVKDESTVEYILPLSLSIFKSNGTRANLVVKAQGDNIGEAVQNRQRRLSKKFVQGQEKLVLVSEEYARYGIKSIIEDRIRNPEASDMAYIAVCNGSPEEYFNYKLKGYSNSSEYIEGLIEASRTFNFFSDNFKLIDSYVRVKAEGRSLVLPYIDKKDDGIEITGLAVFKEDKMVLKTDLVNSRTLSFLKNNNVKGLESLVKSGDKYIDFDGKTGKRKVQCYRDGENYTFIINISIKGSIVNNEMYEGIIEDIERKKEFERDMKKHIEKECYIFLDKMQNEYKVDCIGLGKEAAAKFGRRKNIDWNKVVSNSKIKVNVKVQVETQGRGDY